ncbi:sugar phosphate isomerase/epimerase family protein, partial [Amycolatopsis lurida]|uniref:sugar phosphate isomerase/epimerase family protein n=1 Tax=Amycolatopsis lurida TaxID=31959 RepID=UPI0036558ED5
QGLAGHVTTVNWGAWDGGMVTPQLREVFLARGVALLGMDFVSTGHGDVPWEDCFRALNSIGYAGPISVEWEDAGMDRLRGAAEAVTFLRGLLFDKPSAAFDAAFSNQK